jgi:glycosyltransferase involved in cell wall biosynthesis
MLVMSLRVAYISDERFPGWGTDTQQITKNAEGLARAGAQVDLLLPIHFRVAAMSNTRREERIRQHYGIGNALNIRFLPGWLSSDLRIEKVTHGLAAGLASLLQDYDVVYTRNVLPTWVTVAGQRPTVFENHRVLKRHYPVSHLIMRRLLRKPNFLGVIANCEMVGNAYQAMGLPREQLLVSHLGYDPKDFEPRLERAEARNRLGWPAERTTIAYTGHIGPGKGMEALYALASHLPRLDFRIVGGKPGEVSRSEARVRQLGLSNVHHSPFVKVEEVPPYLYAADALIVPPTSVPLNRFGNTVLPMKLYTYLAAGRPIIAPAQVDVVELLEDGKNAILVPPDDPLAAATKIMKTLDDKHVVERIRAKAVEMAPQYSWSNRGIHILAFIEELMDRYREQRT